MAKKDGKRHEHSRRQKKMGRIILQKTEKDLVIKLVWKRSFARKNSFESVKPGKINEERKILFRKRTCTLSCRGKQKQRRKSVHHQRVHWATFFFFSMRSRLRFNALRSSSSSSSSAISSSKRPISALKLKNGTWMLFPYTNTQSPGSIHPLPLPRIPHPISRSHFFSHHPKEFKNLSKPGDLDNSGRKLILE